MGVLHFVNLVDIPNSDVGPTQCLFLPQRIALDTAIAASTDCGLILVGAALTTIPYLVKLSPRNSSPWAPGCHGDYCPIHRYFLLPAPAYIFNVTFITPATAYTTAKALENRQFLTSVLTCS